MSGELWLWALCALLLALWLLNFLRTDSDLTLLWAEWLGRRPEQHSSLGLLSVCSKTISKKIDILINNGGRAHCSFVVNTNLDVFKELLEVNYLGTVSLTNCVLPHMMKRKQGKIVVMNSIAGILPVPLCSAYVASKHALRVRLLNVVVRGCCLACSQQPRVAFPASGSRLLPK
ncbi:Dehydrogenase/reductase SDR family member 7 [Lemmus lemmus]